MSPPSRATAGRYKRSSLFFRKSARRTALAFFDKNVPRYGNSFVFKTYKIDSNKKSFNFLNPANANKLSDKDLEADLSTILEFYKKTVSLPSATTTDISHGVFYLEKHLEYFLIENWNNTEIGKK